MSLEDERAQFYKLIGALDDRITDQEATRQELKEDVIAAVQKIFEAQKPQLSDEEHRWVQMAIKAEAEKIKFRQAVIEKTITALVWAALAALGTTIWHITREWLINHGYKP